MPDRHPLIRLAAVQLECHPAAYCSHLMPLEEPFFSLNLSLESLSNFGFDQLASKRHA